MVHYAAGILPVTVHAGQVLFLVGQGARDRCWSDFGGKTERVDKNDPLNTATRELWEETYGCLVDARALRSHLSSATCLALRGRTQNNHPYIMFVAQVPYQPHLRNAFHKTLSFLRAKPACRAFVEMVDVQWVTWEQLRGGDLMKRAVFQHTVDSNAHVLQRVAAGEPWDRLCAELAGTHAQPHCLAPAAPAAPAMPRLGAAEETTAVPGAGASGSEPQEAR